MSNCIQCRRKVKRTASTNGQFYLCGDCGDEGWVFIQRADEWILARDLNVPEKLRQTSYLRDQRQRLQGELEQVNAAIRAIEARFVKPELTDLRTISS